ncbi:MAG TPA: hypothetical protein VMV72_19620 [Verrucomicrobiae bacterium]|nr:hypothetical protein [Verrucomicrobiae bacterium]
MKHFLYRTGVLSIIYAALAAWMGAASSLAQTNFTSSLAQSNSTLSAFAASLTARPADVGDQPACDGPTLSDVLCAGSDENGNVDAGGYNILNLEELYVNDRFHAFWGNGGAGAYAIEDPNNAGNTLADFAVAFGYGNYFSDTQPGDVCFRSLNGPIRIGCQTQPWPGEDSTSILVARNGDVTITKGTLYLTPRGDLSMGSFTNSPAH